MKFFLVVRHRLAFFFEGEGGNWHFFLGGGCFRVKGKGY